MRGTGVVPLAGDYPTTSALIEYCESDWRNAQAAIAVNTLELLSPVTTRCRIFCQGAYPFHVATDQPSNIDLDQMHPFSAAS